MNHSQNKANEIYQFINAPERIESIEHMHQLIADANCLTLIEKSFFQEVEVIIKEISTNNIAGDIVFVGVFKGGAALYLQALFEHYGCKRKVWLFDSFKGFNREQITHEEDKKALELFGTDEYFKELVSVDQISKLFKRFDLFENTVLIEGFIEDTLKQQQITSIAFLHIDVDCYEPTYYALEQLHAKISPGGWCVCDDYFVPLFDCKKAIDDFRTFNTITSPIKKIGNYPAGWRVK
jgi:hypothetical protein